MTQARLLEQLGEQRRKVDFDTYDISVQQLLSMLSDRVINIAPAYQRLYRWKDDRQSQLIESIFLGIPIPSLFMATDRDGTWEVVDGVQRLSTLVRYAGSDVLRDDLSIKSKLNVSGLDKLSELTGTFDELPHSLQLQFLLRPVKVVTLSDKSDLIVRFDLFERLNTGGIALTNQEIRSCIFRGPFDDFLHDMATSEDFKSIVQLTSASELDGTREEMVLRFFAFTNNYKAFDHSVVEFLNDYMKSAADKFNYREGERDFYETFNFLMGEFPNGLTGKSGKTPINLYEGIVAGTALALRTGKPLVKGVLKSWATSNEMKSYATGATNSPNRVTSRIFETYRILVGERNVQ